MDRERCDILELLNGGKSSDGFLRVAAPMVRYSKLEFRRLLKKHGVQLRFTPMIIADSFTRSEKARQNEFTTAEDDIPVIAQFAAKDANEFVNAAQLVYPYVDGVDLNCGCPQSWAIAKGYGCGLLKNPELVKDIISTTRRTLNEHISISVKIRLLQHASSRTTVEFARQLEMCGATFISLHGRTMWQKTSEPLNVEAIRDIKDALNIPLIANGSVKTWDDACTLHKQTGADGVMVARGLLSNPALFNMKYKNATVTPIECVQDWLDIAAEAGENLHFLTFHHHLTFMWGAHLKRKERLEFNSFTTKEEIFNFFADNYNIKPTTQFIEKSYPPYTNCSYDHFQPEIKDVNNVEDCTSSWNSNTKGKFFSEFSEELDADDDCSLGNSFFADM
ncbi:tRNA-dihydrouridine(20a/20b) synthase [NAD(P)+]-like [Musca domestica]|uniref:tRNA-dihydrouridine(20a/20b) synthase [NAD(P)+]-like n=1 Tax=Musca domestica TaxID=7370 RepID=A0A1I8M4T1_MUSDO|nr:tRNA-dihydrouridine(20a/20b) synthase [NAD(P)+]-like [Musca domestica]